jgi:small subunit ribosomal protein S16
MGRRHRPYFRINAVESRTPRDGKVLEQLGRYDPIEKDQAKQVVLDLERVKYWLDKGAIPSETVSQILLRLGIKNKSAEVRTTRRARAKALARAKGRFFTKAEKVAAEKAAKEAAEKVEADAKAQAEAKAKALAEEKRLAEAKAKEAKAQAEAEQPKKENGQS